MELVSVERISDTAVRLSLGNKQIGIVEGNMISRSLLLSNLFASVFEETSACEHRPLQLPRGHLGTWLDHVRSDQQPLSATDITNNLKLLLVRSLLYVLRPHSLLLAVSCRRCYRPVSRIL
jgi:hypothetical protein